MEKNGALDNRVFITALAGSLLFIMTIWFTITNLSSIQTLNMPYLVGAGSMSLLSLSMLAAAVKKEKTGFGEIA